jgi:ribosomal-protein-alanine N-acetyltransferase
MTAPTLQTARLSLRQWRREDLLPYAALNADPLVMEHYPRALSREESDASAARIAAGLAANPFGLWAVEIIGACPFIGDIGLAEAGFSAPFTPCVEIGWRLAREHWGRGYATEAATAVCDYAFGPLGLNRLVSFTTPANWRSRRVMEALGMRRDESEDFDHPDLAPGHALRRHVLYRTTAAEWTKRRSEAQLA